MKHSFRITDVLEMTKAFSGNKGFEHTLVEMRQNKMFLCIWMVNR